MSFQELDEEVESLLCRAEKLLEDESEEVKRLPENEEELIRFAEASRRAKAAAERSPVLCRRFGQNVSREDAMQAVEEW